MILSLFLHIEYDWHLLSRHAAFHFVSEVLFFPQALRFFGDKKWVLVIFISPATAHVIGEQDTRNRVN